MSDQNTETDVGEVAPAAEASEAPHTSSPAPPSEAPFPASQTESRNTRLICQLIAVASFIMVLWHLQDGSLKNANTGSRYATVESLVDYGTYNINKSRYNFTIDKYKRSDGFISSKPPVLSTYGAGVYWVYQRITGKTIAEYEGDVVWIVSLFTGGLFHVIFLLFFYKFCRLLLARQLAIIGAMAAAGFSYLGVAYATAINNHSPAAALAVVAFFYAYRARNESENQPRNLMLAGLVFGFLPAFDLPSYAFLPAAALYVGLPNYKRALLYFVPALLPGLLFQFWLTYLATGSIKPTYLNSELKDYAGNYFRERRSGIDALREPKHIYAFNVFFGHHGLFSMTPVFLFGAWELGRSLLKRVRLPEALFVTSVLGAFFAFYVFRTRSYGGWCVGMRWLVPIMPLLLLYFALWLDRVKLTRLTWNATLLAFAVGAFHVQDGLTSPFQFSRWHNWIENKPNRGRVGEKMNMGRAYKRDLKKKKRQKKRKKRKSRTP